MKKYLILLLLMMVHVTVFATALKPNAPRFKMVNEDSWSTTFYWILPDSYTDGTPFPEGVEVSQVKIFRNLKELTLLDGPVTEFEDFRICPEHPDGYDCGLLMYEVSVKVGDEWSEPSIPIQYFTGVLPYVEQIPLEPQCKGIPENEMGYFWRCDSKVWKSTDEGMAYTADASVENRDLVYPYVIFFEHRHDYVLEYQISSSDNTEYEIVMCEGIDYNLSEIELYQELVTDAVATDDNSVKKVEFTYRIKTSYEGKSPYGGSYSRLYTCPTIVLRPLHGNNLLLSSMRIYESETTTAPNVFNDDDIREVRFYDLQGRSAGADPECLTPGIYIRQQTDSHGNMRCDKWLVR